MPEGLLPLELHNLQHDELSKLMTQVAPLQKHFNRSLTIGGFPELVLPNVDDSTYQVLSEEVVDKVIKRDALTLIDPLLDKLFLYLCMKSSKVFDIQSAANALETTSLTMIEDYVNFLEQSNLIYVSNSIAVGKKESLKGRPKIYIADVAIRNAVLKPFDIMSNGEEMQVTIETLVFRHLISFYQNAPMVHIGYYQKLNESQKEEDIIVIELPKEKILCGVNYRNNANLTGSDAIIALSKEEGTKVTSAFVIIKVLRIMAIAKHDTLIPVLRIPALAFIYLLGRAEAKGENLKLKYKVICHFAIMYKIHFSGLPGFSSYFLLAFFQ